MTATKTADGRTVELVETEVEKVRIRVLPNGRMDRANAAKYVNRSPKTLATWAMEGKGPPVHRAGGRCFYYQQDLDQFLGGPAAA